MPGSLRNGARPKLDLDNARLPVPLPETPLLDGEELSRRWLGALGEAAGPSRELVAAGLLPPHALAGNTIFLAFSHYDLAGGIYAREQVSYARPLRLDEPLVVTGEIAATYRRRGRRYRIMTSQTRDASGAVVVASCSTGVERFRTRAELAGVNEEPPHVAAPAADLEAGRENPCRERLASLVEEEALQGAKYVVTLEMMRAVAGDEDRNPIHTDPEVARQAGLAAPIAGGTHVLAFVQELLMRELGPEVLLHGAYVDVRWVRPVAAGEWIEPRAVVHATREQAVIFDVAVDCEGELAMLGRVEVPR